MAEERSGGNAARDPIARGELRNALTELGDHAGKLRDAMVPAVDPSKMVGKFDLAKIDPPDLAKAFTPSSFAMADTASMFRGLSERHQDMLSQLAVERPRFEFEFRDYALEAARESNERLEEMARLLAESQEAQRLQTEEHARREEEHAAREDRALDLAAKSHREARTQRIITAWSMGVAVLALVAAVVVPLIVG